MDGKFYWDRSDIQKQAQTLFIFWSDGWPFNQFLINLEPVIMNTAIFTSELSTYYPITIVNQLIIEHLETLHPSSAV